MKAAKKPVSDITTFIRRIRAAQAAFMSNEWQLGEYAKAWAGGENAGKVAIDLFYRGRPLNASWAHYTGDIHKKNVVRVKFDAANPHNFFYNDTQWKHWLETLGPRLTN